MDNLNHTFFKRFLQALKDTVFIPLNVNFQQFYFLYILLRQKAI
ncbi:hypothetical protein N0824_02650 [Microcystis sp. 0824]|nr:hypothetical protein N0824_02650 [Microcystis sp. 0824]